jgi:hypothetical protein
MGHAKLFQITMAVGFVFLNDTASCQELPKPERCSEKFTAAVRIPVAGGSLGQSASSQLGERSRCLHSKGATWYRKLGLVQLTVGREEIQPHAQRLADLRGTDQM